MDYVVTLQTATPRPLAVVWDRATLAELPSKIIANSGLVWNFLKSNQIANDGQNIVIYFPPADCRENPLLTPEGVALDIGAGVLGPFTPIPPIIASQVPGGRVATTIHIGPYHLLGEAHAAIHRWCGENDHRLAGPNWELYGHWTDDPAQLRTDVFYLLR